MTSQTKMPNQPRPDNPARSIRIEDGLWHAAMIEAQRRGEPISYVIRQALYEQLEFRHNPIFDERVGKVCIFCDEQWPCAVTCMLRESSLPYSSH